jgi:FKBP-type peptidyl-prolyl cis-trans isomerase FkpA
MKRKKRILFYIILSGLILTSLASCIKQKERSEMQEASEIQKFLKDNYYINFDLKPSGLYYHESVAGTGSLLKDLDTAYIFYTGKFLDGTLGETNVGTTDTLILTVNAGYFFPGFEEGITYMKEGGRALLLIPSKLAYGSKGYYNIPGYTPLLFYVTLVRVKPGPLSNIVSG